MDPRTESALRRMGSDFQRIVTGLPTLPNPPLPDDWLASEMAERWLLLQHAPIRPGRRVVEVGSGAHALTTVPLAHAVGPQGRVVALERARWQHFREVVGSSGLGPRVEAVQADARRLPLSADAADLALCVHGIRSLGQDRSCAQVLREMLRVASRIFLAETLPVARTPAQQAHLSMYGLREKVLLARTGQRDDLAYRPLAELCALVEAAGGIVEDRRTLDVDLPHALAYFPRAMIDRVDDPADRAELQARWCSAFEEIRTYGEDHPPVGLVLARR